MDHIYTLDAEFVSIDNLGNLKVTVKNDRVIEIETIVAAAFPSGERLEQLGIPKERTIRVALNSTVIEYEKYPDTLNKPKLTITRHWAPFLIESQLVYTMNCFLVVSLNLVPSDVNTDVLHWVLQFHFCNQTRPGSHEHYQYQSSTIPNWFLES